MNITTPRFPLSQTVEIVVTTDGELTKREDLLSGIRGRIARYQHAMSLVEQTWPNGWAPDALLAAAQTGNRISLHPETAAQEIQQLRAAAPEITRQLQALLKDLETQPAKTGDISVGTTMQRQREAVKRALAHIKE